MKTLAMIFSVSLLSLSLQGCVILSDTAPKVERMQLAEAKPEAGTESAQLPLTAAPAENPESAATELMVDVLRDVFVPIFTALLARG